MMALGVLWLVAAAHRLHRYPAIPTTAAERASLRAARQGIGLLDGALVALIVVLLEGVPKYALLFADLGVQLPALTAGVLDISHALRGDLGGVWLALILGGGLALHRPLLDRFGWRRGRWIRAASVLVVLAGGALLPVILWLPFRSLCCVVVG